MKSRYQAADPRDHAFSVSVVIRLAGGRQTQSDVGWARGWRVDVELAILAEKLEYLEERPSGGGNPSGYIYVSILKRKFSRSGQIKSAWNTS